MEDCYHIGVKALIHNQAGKVLLLKATPRHGKGSFWDIPGGRVQRGETPEQTLTREIAEETGVADCKVMSPVMMVLSKVRIPIGKSDVGLVFAIYACTIASDAKLQLSNEHDEAGWFDPAEAASLVERAYPLQFTEYLRALNL